jgi:hypothetical protein
MTKPELGSLAGGHARQSIPPSITMVVYAVQANVSIIQVPRQFLPGLLVMALYSGFRSGRRQPKRTPPGRSVHELQAHQNHSILFPVCLDRFVFLSLLMVGRRRQNAQPGSVLGGSDAGGRRADLAILLGSVMGAG